MMASNRAQPLPVLKPHVILTFDRLQHYEDCEQELKRLKKGRPGEEKEEEEGQSQAEAGASDPAASVTSNSRAGRQEHPSSWDNRARILKIPNNDTSLNIKTPKHYPPLLRARNAGGHPEGVPPRSTRFEDDDGGLVGAGAGAVPFNDDDEDDAADGGLVGAGAGAGRALDPSYQAKTSFDIQQKRASAMAAVQEQTDEDDPLPITSADMIGQIVDPPTCHPSKEREPSPDPFAKLISLPSVKPAEEQIVKQTESWYWLGPV